VTILGNIFAGRNRDRYGQAGRGDPADLQDGG
jgi:hypothetical protein